MMTINQAWASFSTQVIPPDASDVQRREMKLAFYAGVAALAHLELHVADDSVSEAEGEAVLQAAHKELHEYKDAVLRGEA